MFSQIIFDIAQQNNLNTLSKSNLLAFRFLRIEKILIINM